MIALQWFFWGIVATLAQMLFEAAMVGLQLTRMTLPLMLGTMWTPDRSRAKIIGTALHFVNGLVFTLIYLAVFHFWGAPRWWRGGLIGLAHAAVVLLLGMEVLPSIHPRMASDNCGPIAKRQLEPPGFLALNYGPGTPISILISHVIFGMTLRGLLPVRRSGRVGRVRLAPARGLSSKSAGSPPVPSAGSPCGLRIPLTGRLRPPMIGRLDERCGIPETR